MLPAELKIAIPAKQIRHHYIYLASDEYQSNVDMRLLAEAHIIEHGPLDPATPLFVTVFEHGGWYETFVRLTVGKESKTCRIRTANDRAEYPKEVEAVQMMYRALPVKVELRTHWRRRPAADGGGFYPASG